MVEVDAHNGRWTATAQCGQGLPSLAGELLGEQAVGQPGLGHGRLPPKGQEALGVGCARGGRLEATVDLGVDPAHEEGSHTGHMGQVLPAGGGQRLQSGHVGLDDLGVTGQAEDESDIDAAALADHLTNGGDALGGGRNLDQGVGPVDALVEGTSGPDGAFGVVGQGGGHLHRHVAVAPVGRVIDRPEDGQGRLDVVDHQVPVGVLDRLGADEFTEFLVVGVLTGDGLGEDGGVGCDPPDPLGHQTGHGAVLEPVPPHVVEPGTLALLLVEVGECGHGIPFGRRGTVTESATRSRARAATFSGVKPNSSSATCPGAEAPKWSMLTVASA